MKVLGGKEFAKLLERLGWRLIRTKGSHHVFAKDGFRERITLPIHGNTALKLGLQTGLMKIAGIKEDEI
jgi:predicted RNA binding protein YcfA (HicA-like mRNA interferase family)